MKFSEATEGGIMNTTLKAEVAMRHEDWRIAKKHEREAEDHVADSDTTANQAALRRAQDWTRNRWDAYRDALGSWNASAEKWMTKEGRS